MPNSHYSDSDLRQAVKVSRSLAQVLRILNLTEAGGNYKSLKRKLQVLNIDTSHFSSQSWRKGVSTPVKPPVCLSELLKEGSFYSTYKLKKRLLQEKIKEPICESCKLTTWMGQVIPLELHHKNGVNTDFSLRNLELLCPNCHALTPSYRGKNKRRQICNNSMTVMDAS